ncbi:MCE family protein [Nocardia mangyaensis]|uniref:MCE family protein n=1 Tax=Nocardia mangyaensis TaxID=2213200 RepID=UPI00267583DC|nr:MCE family protein [Nocardia mangyaensis]MDO3649263.1 MCE family protein [Nocardia mangyaensis]
MYPDPSGRGWSRRRLGLAGVAMAVSLSSVVALLGLRYAGYFDDAVAVTARMTSTGDGLPARADVRFRGMLVGAVSAVEIAERGLRQRVELALEPAAAEAIPSSVTARVVPANIFGVSSIELVDNGAAPALRAGAVIEQDTSSATVALQTTLTTLRDVLDRIQPAKLARVLATLADALDGEARLPGSTIERLDEWITEVRALPGIGELLGDLGAAAAAVNQSAPELVDALGRSVQTARTITERRAQLIDLLTAAGTATAATQELFARNPDAGKELVVGLDETFGALAADPAALTDTIRGLNTSLNRLASVFNWGPSRQMRWNVTVSFTPFRQYTAADCPRYGPQAGPRCGGASVPEVAAPQQYPTQLIPGWLSTAGPAPLPAPPGVSELSLPALPGLTLPTIPGLSLPTVPGLVIPGLTAPTSSEPPVQDPPARPISLSGSDAVAAIVGGRPNTTQLLLLGPVLAGSTVTLTPPGDH